MIIVKPKGVDFPDKKLLEKAFRKNPDGAGFAYNNNFAGETEYVKIYKGFMGFDSFYKPVSYLKKIYIDSPEKLIDKTFVFHFRKATKGEISPKMTQPFPVTYQMDKLISNEVSTQYAFCHKGTFDFLSSRTKKGRGVSDTYIFVQEYLALLAMNEEHHHGTVISWYDRWYNQELLKNLVTDKACILKSNGDFEVIGEFFEHNGLLISEKIS